ncbi:MAG: efflux RND transporter permease subunit [Clostridia bacterium]|nr:efflux RND transporter permease subunit [Clostridia bacterium]
MGIFTKFSLKNVLVIIILVIMIISGGLISTSTINKESMPDISIPTLLVSTLYPGANPRDVEDEVSGHIQKTLSGIEDVKSVQTYSTDNMSIAVVELSDNSDIEDVKRQVEEAVNKVKLPERAQKSQVLSAGFNMYPIITYSIEGDMPEKDISRLVQEKVIAELEGIKGVSIVDIQGNQAEKIYIRLDEQKLREHGLTVRDVKDAFSMNDISFPLGQVSQNGAAFGIRLTNKLLTVNDIKSVPIIVPFSQKSFMEKVGGGFKGVEKAISDMGKAVSSIGQGLEQTSEAVGQIGNGMSLLQQQMERMGQMIGNNNRQSAILAGLQRNQSVIQSQKEILANPKTNEQQRNAAIAQISSAQKEIEALQTELKLLLDEALRHTTNTRAAANANAKNVGGKTNFSDIPAKNTVESNSDSDTQDTSEAGLIKTVFLSELADVTIAPENTQFYSRNNLKKSMILNVFKSNDANTIEISERVKSVLDKIKSENEGLHFNLISDSAEGVEESVNGMAREGLIGAVLAVLVIAIFLRDLRATIISVVSIPISILAAIIILPWFDITLNSMSLGGISVAIGRIVDDSIVVMENIYRRFQASAAEKRTEKEKLLLEASNEVGSAITSSTITTIAVFIPLGFVTGVVGKIFTAFAITVVVCMLASLLVAITVVPAMSKLMLLNSKMKHVEGTGRIQMLYKRILRFCLSHRLAVTVVSLSLVIGSFGLISKTGIQFLPATESKLLSIKLNMKPGTAFEQTNHKAMKIEEYLTADENVKTVVSAVGDTSASQGAKVNMQGVNQASFKVILKDDVNIGKAVDKIREGLSTLEDENAGITVSSQLDVGTGETLDLMVQGNNTDDIRAASELIRKEIEDIKGLKNISNNLADEKNEIVIKVNMEKASQQGLNPTATGGLIRSALNYDNIMKIEKDSTDINVGLGIKQEDMDSTDKIRQLEFNGANGILKLGDIADVSVQKTPVSISKEDGKLYASIEADIAGQDTQKVSREVLDRIDKIKAKLPEGTTYDLRGSNKNITEGFGQMGIAILTAVCMVFIVIVITFGSIIYPLAIMVSLPFAGVGGIFTLFIMGKPITMTAMIGMLMLTGIVVTNAIVLLDRVKTNRNSGMPVNEALEEAGAVRLRPIFMTAIATIIALIPTAFGFSGGNGDMSADLALVVLGGLSLCTLLTLIIVPVVFSYLEGIRSISGVNRKGTEAL